MGDISSRTPRFVTVNRRFAVHELWLQMFWSKLQMGWETIIKEWRGSITEEAIAEAISLSRQAFLEHADKYVLVGRIKQKICHGKNEFIIARTKQLRHVQLEVFCAD